MEFEAALLLFRRIGLLVGEANCWRNLGHTALRLGQAKAARSFCERALAVNLHVGSRLGEANCLYTLGEVARDLEEWDRAEALFQEARQCFQAIGQGVGQANCSAGLGEIAAARSDVAEAKRFFEEALRLNQEVPRPAAIGRSHLYLAKLAPPGSPDRREHIEAARRVWEEAGILDQMRHELEAVPAD